MMNFETDVAGRDKQAIDNLSRVSGTVYSDEQRDILMHRGGMCILACAGSGKALVNGTGVLTAYGYVGIDELEVGDRVYGEDGKLHNVTGVYPQDNKKRVYEVTFNDGVTIECCGEHLWKVVDLRDKQAGEFVGTTLKMKEMLENGSSRVAIPMTKPVEFSKKQLPLDAYTMGVLLAAGSKTYEIMRDLSLQFELDSNKAEKAIRGLIAAGAEITNCPRSYKVSIAKEDGELIDTIGTVLFKFPYDGDVEGLPYDYMLSSIEDRVNILKGAFSVGWVDEEGAYTLELFSSVLTDNLLEICNTLGLPAFKRVRTLSKMVYTNDVDEIVNVNVYQIKVYTTKYINNLGSKKNGFSGKESLSDYRLVSKVVETNRFEDMTCIMVDNPSSLFLTEGCVVTHNTTLINSLIAKRILTGEIEDTSKLLCATYSKAGATEMEQRLKVLLQKLGITDNITVKTLHALYLGVLKEFGYPSAVIEGRDRSRYIREACKDIDIYLDDEDFKTLDGLLSYQVNNLLSDEALVQMCVYTLTNISLSQYSAIRKGYSTRKVNARVVDFDDMQLYMYSLVFQQGRQDIIDYCKAKWTDIYVDEAQDMSKIQYAILKSIITDADKFVLVGDDDQCLVEGTQVGVPWGTVAIEGVSKGDKVKSCTGVDGLANMVVDGTSVTYVATNIVELKTMSGNTLRGTPNHTGFKLKLGEQSIAALNNRVEFNYLSSKGTDKTRCTVSAGVLPPENSEILIRCLAENSEDYQSTGCISEPDKFIRELKKYFSATDKGTVISENITLCEHKYEFTALGDIKVGDYVPVVSEDGTVEPDEVVDVQMVRYSGNVYDISVPKTRNFVANGVVVHNCIYQWRGADPSIILNVCADYDIKRFVLSTNYRCAGNIVDKAAVGIKHNSVRSDKSMKPYRKGGEIKVCDCKNANLYNMSKYALQHIKSLIVEEGVSPNEIALLSRNNAHLSILGNMLFREGIYTTSTAEMKMTKLTPYFDLKSVLNIAEDGYNHNLTSETLYNICLSLTKRDALKIAQMQDKYGAKLSDVLGYIAKKIWDRQYVDYSGNINPNNISDMHLNRSLNSVREDTKDSVVMVYNLLTSGNKAECAKGLLSLYSAATAWRLDKQVDKKRTVDGLISYFTDMLNTLGYEDTMRFLKISEQYEQGKLAVPGAKVVMSTMHGAKGKEWGYVVLFADDNVAFPSFSGICARLSRGVEMEDISNNIDENRRLHYVAMTRAKKQLAVFTYANNVGLYLLEALGIFDYPSNNNEIINMAKSGVMYPELAEKAKDIIFAEGAEYRYDIDISNVSCSLSSDYSVGGTKQ